MTLCCKHSPGVNDNPYKCSHISDSTKIPRLPRHHTMSEHPTFTLSLSDHSCGIGTIRCVEIAGVKHARVIDSIVAFTRPPSNDLVTREIAMNTARRYWQRMSQSKKDELGPYLQTHHFARRGEGFSDVITLDGLMKLIMWLEGDVAKEYRTKMVDIVSSYLKSNPSIIPVPERETQAPSLGSSLDPLGAAAESGLEIQTAGASVGDKRGRDGEPRSFTEADMSLTLSRVRDDVQAASGALMSMVKGYADSLAAELAVRKEINHEIQKRMKMEMDHQNDLIACYKESLELSKSAVNYFQSSLIKPLPLLSLPSLAQRVSLSPPPRVARVATSPMQSSADPPVTLPPLSSVDQSGTLPPLSSVDRSDTLPSLASLPQSVALPSLASVAQSGFSSARSSPVTWGAHSMPSSVHWCAPPLPPSAVQPAAGEVPPSVVQPAAADITQPVVQPAPSVVPTGTGPFTSSDTTQKVTPLSRTEGPSGRGRPAGKRVVMVNGLTNPLTIGNLITDCWPSITRAKRAKLTYHGVKTMLRTGTLVIPGAIGSQAAYDARDHTTVRSVLRKEYARLFGGTRSSGTPVTSASSSGAKAAPSSGVPPSGAKAAPIGSVSSAGAKAAPPSGVPPSGAKAAPLSGVSSFWARVAPLCSVSSAGAKVPPVPFVSSNEIWGTPIPVVASSGGASVPSNPRVDAVGPVVKTEVDPDAL